MHNSSSCKLVDTLDEFDYAQIEMKLKWKWNEFDGCLCPVLTIGFFFIYLGGCDKRTDDRMRESQLFNIRRKHIMLFCIFVSSIQDRVGNHVCLNHNLESSIESLIIRLYICISSPNIIPVCSCFRPKSPNNFVLRRDLNADHVQIASHTHTVTQARNVHSVFLGSSTVITNCDIVSTR